MTRYQLLISLASKKLEIQEDLVYRVYLAYWRQIRDLMQSHPLKQDLTLEEFNALRPNITLPHLGKLFILYPRYLDMRNRYKIFGKGDD